MADRVYVQKPGKTIRTLRSSYYTSFLEQYSFGKRNPANCSCSHFAFRNRHLYEYKQGYTGGSRLRSACGCLFRCRFAWRRNSHRQSIYIRNLCIRVRVLGDRRNIYSCPAVIPVCILHYRPLGCRHNHRSYYSTSSWSAMFHHIRPECRRRRV